MRPDGFPVADIDVRLLSDARVIRAVRAAGPVVVVGYVAVLSASWARGERVDALDAVDALPRVYDLDADVVVAALVAVGLLDATGRVPAATWASWYAPANDRREARRESGRKGGLRSGATRRAKRDEANAKQTGSDASRSNEANANPTDRTTSLTGGRSDGPDANLDDDPYAGASFGDRLAAHGYRPD